jgi:hypothetical protein
MKLRILGAAVLASGLALISTTVSAKGLQEVTVSGPGLVSPIRFSDNFANELARRSASLGALRMASRPVHRPVPSAHGTERHTAGTSGRVSPHSFDRTCTPSLPLGLSHSRLGGRSHSKAD